MAKIKINFSLSNNKSKFCKIGVWSVKGGVGKTTMSIAIAKSLSKTNLVGLIDADITSPNITEYLNIKENLVGDKKRNIIYPLRFGNMEIVSMGSLIGEQPVFWRGIMLSKAVEDFVERVDWKAKNLVIDLPPGTSDILMTMIDTIKIDNFVLVTTPSRIAIKELKRSILFLKNFGVNIGGIIENMVSEVYPSLKEKIEKELGIKVLTTIPYNKKVKETIDKGESIDVLFKKDFEEISKSLLCKET